MAIDAYLQIADIKGESNDEKHKGWIEVRNVDWSVNQPRATSISTAGGHTNAKADLSVVSFDKLADLASPILFQHCAMGKTIPKAVFEFYRADGEGKPICYFKLELENVMISKFHPNSGNGGTLAETVHLAYARIKSTYTQQKIGGGAGGSTMGGWDASANKVHA
ncbi:Hcp family type VI secretion system effector [Massilia horti]|uniref:Type VI secretion system tube protein Hcp n=1 Tax=Massilia horti TaxID=2562153 RepID=A0A4Y9T4C5_9BURK|nr:type VI secretion system tube protein Hcp [Massilia horti]TFW32454.1 type VI secretion system tube protein Hcp [Massilia horti]